MIFLNNGPNSQKLVAKIENNQNFLLNLQVEPKKSFSRPLLLESKIRLVTHQLILKMSNW